MKRKAEQWKKFRTIRVWKDKRLLSRIEYRDNLHWILLYYNSDLIPQFQNLLCKRSIFGLLNKNHEVKNWKWNIDMVFINAHCFSLIRKILPYQIQYLAFDSIDRKQSSVFSSHKRKSVCVCVWSVRRKVKFRKLGSHFRKHFQIIPMFY